jgi:flagellin-like hook-associated protein FlgL
MDWDNIAPMIVMSIGFLSVAAIWILRGPLGKAMADRIAGRAGTALPEGDAEQLRTDIDLLRAELGAVQERLDFTERMLARGPDQPGALKPGA